MSYPENWIIADLTNLRKELGISRREVAEAIDVIEATITKWENNETDPGSRSIVSYARFLKYEFDLHPIDRKSRHV